MVLNLPRSCDQIGTDPATTLDVSAEEAVMTRVWTETCINVWEDINHADIARDH